METLVLDSLFNKAAGRHRLQHNSFDYCEIFRNTYFEEHLRTAVSVHSNDLLKYKNCVIKNMLPEKF